MRISRICQIRLDRRFNVPRHYRNVCRVFGLVVKRSYNVGMIRCGLPGAKRRQLDVAVPPAEKRKFLLTWLLLAWLATGWQTAWFIVGMVFILAGYLLADHGSLRFVANRRGWCSVPAAGVLDGVLFVAKGFGAVCAAVNGGLRLRPGHRC